MACFPQVSRAVLAVSAVMAAVLSHSAQGANGGAHRSRRAGVGPPGALRA
jgi:hypothetical protein